MRKTLDFADFSARAAARLRPEPPGFLDEPGRRPRGDHDHGESGFAAPSSLPRPAAVLVPIVLRPEEPSVLLTVRAAALRAHSGQIAFPGGKMDPDDPSPLETALREAEEEIGLCRSRVRPLGFLDPYLSATNYLVAPCVALVEPDGPLALNPEEVASAFEVPLGFLMNEANHELHAREWKGRVRQYYALPFRDRYIWGVTAGILRNMYERLYDA